MNLFTQMEQEDYEQVVVCQDKESGLKAIIAIHDTTLGPALGGTRMWTYSSEEAAFEDALRLARGMTYKNAAAGLNLGGGKTVIIGDPKKDKNEAMFRAFGRFIQGLNGRYITAEDVGTTVSDMDLVYSETDYVTGVSPAFGSSGNPSPVTAYGVYVGIKAAAKKAYGTDSLAGKKIAVQGIGNVAYSMCQYLHEEGAELIVTDINKESVERAVQEFGATAVGINEIYDVECDIYSPCALGATINDDTISRLKANVIAGAANNQLLENRHGDLLQEKGIVYAPDYVINSGGVINVADELLGYNRDRAMKKVETIYDSIERIFEISERDNIPTYVAANRLAEERIETMRKSRRQFLQNGMNILSRGR
ncbi:Leu/Phe/Val dehydrogenase [Alkalicoccus halolimnae]|uniref:Leucine dehydrogenase n=1 Tax=Alkalicoccus halolimnae TaxID=1667239 RepID=A0A5C7FJ92_9BACI|nr:Glu/Leu/Phe/Val dehydrogenase [Alkalicoccus halolimnae]TXF86354.1 Glu/Leu/Phe/Val dehydrogenase [Alkalicoccus halolimnae]